MWMLFQMWNKQNKKLKGERASKSFSYDWSVSWLIDVMFDWLMADYTLVKEYSLTTVGRGMCGYDASATTASSYRVFTSTGRQAEPQGMLSTKSTPPLTSK